MRIRLLDSDDGGVTVQNTSELSLVAKFEVGDWAFLRISLMKGVVHFEKKGKLSPRYIGPYKILQRIGQVAYELELSSELEFVYPVFHVSMSRKCIGDPSRVVPIKDVQVTEVLSYEEVPVAILDRQVHRLRTRDVASVKVLWRNKNMEEMIWETEEEMKSKYPYLFQNEDNKEDGGTQDTLEGETAL
ncbi:uncharacterized protein [Nicotiana sylvestris]|uniref:uncharacterized protein n=1 Tax=Nicotiana sylvestris TaxID=4096 RepID=UPI00388CE017